MSVRRPRRPKNEPALTIGLDQFRWRKTQKRLVSDDAALTWYDEFYVVGKYNTILFKSVGNGVDPKSRLNKQAKIFKPCLVSTPDEYKDLTLYVHY